MNDELRDKVTRAASTTDEAVAMLPLSGAETALMEEIMSTPVLAEPMAEPPQRQRRRRLRLVPVAVAAALALLAGGLWLSGDEGGAPAYAAEAVRVAEANARILVDEPGWNVTRVDEFTVTEGEMTFGKGELRLDVHWSPREQYRMFVDDRRHSSEPVHVEVLGKQGLMFRYSDTDLTTILPPEGPNFLEIRGGVGDEQAYRGILAALTTVDVQTWLDALPDSAVKPQDQSAEVDRMLKDVPLPVGFDRDSIKPGDGVRDRYQLGAAVVHAVVCGWIDQWREGKQSGDDEAVAGAVQAMRDSRSWPVLREMNKDGDYPEAVWEVSDQMADGTLDAGATCEKLGL